MAMGEDLQHSNALTVIITVMVLTPLTTLFVGARVYGCLVILRRRMHLDEWLGIIALVRFQKKGGGRVRLVALACPSLRSQEG